MIFFFIKSRTFPFSLKRSTSWMFFGKSQLPASLLLCFGAISKLKKGLCEHKHCSMMTVHLVHKMALLSDGWQCMLDKGMIQIPSRTKKMLQDFITLLRRVHRLKLTNCLFLEFSIYCFWQLLTMDNFLGLHEAPENKTADKREILYGYIQKLG